MLTPRDKHGNELRYIALPVAPHHLLLGEVTIPLLGRIHIGQHHLRASESVAA